MNVALMDRLTAFRAVNDENVAQAEAELSALGEALAHAQRERAEATAAADEARAEVREAQRAAEAAERAEAAARREQLAQQARAEAAADQLARTLLLQRSAEGQSHAVGELACRSLRRKYLLLLRYRTARQRALRSALRPAALARARRPRRPRAAALVAPRRVAHGASDGGVGASRPAKEREVGRRLLAGVERGGARRPRRARAAGVGGPARGGGRAARRGGGGARGRGADGARRPPQAPQVAPRRPPRVGRASCKQLRAEPELEAVVAIWLPRLACACALRRLRRRVRTIHVLKEERREARRGRASVLLRRWWRRVDAVAARRFAALDVVAASERAGARRALRSWNGQTARAAAVRASFVRATAGTRRGARALDGPVPGAAGGGGDVRRRRRGVHRGARGGGAAVVARRAPPAAAGAPAPRTRPRVLLPFARAEDLARVVWPRPPIAQDRRAARPQGAPVAHAHQRRCVPRPPGIRRRAPPRRRRRRRHRRDGRPRAAAPRV